MKQFVLTIALMLMLVGTAAAQRNSYSSGLWEGDTMQMANLEGIEASAGIVDPEDDTRWGHTFALRNDESNLTVSINYTSATPNFAEPNAIVGGSWAMSIYKQGEFKGMLFGDIALGTMEYKITRGGEVSSAAVSAELRIKGGTGIFANSGGPRTYGTFHGLIRYEGEVHPKITGLTSLVF